MAERDWLIERGLLRPAKGPVRFDRQIKMWAEADGPTAQPVVDAPTLALLPGERERFEREARNPPAATFPV